MENAERLLRVLDQFGFSSLGVTTAQLPEPNRRLLLGKEPCRIDIMTGISGVTFSEAWSGRYLAKLDDIELPFIGVNEFLKNKLSTTRERDHADAAELKRFLSVLNKN